MYHCQVDEKHPGGKIGQAIRGRHLSLAIDKELLESEGKTGKVSAELQSDGQFTDKHFFRKSSVDAINPYFRSLNPSRLNFSSSSN